MRKSKVIISIFILLMFFIFNTDLQAKFIPSEYHGDKSYGVTVRHKKTASSEGENDASVSYEWGRTNGNYGDITLTIKPKNDKLNFKKNEYIYVKFYSIYGWNLKNIRAVYNPSSVVKNNKSAPNYDGTCHFRGEFDILLTKQGEQTLSIDVYIENEKKETIKIIIKNIKQSNEEIQEEINNADITDDWKTVPAENADAVTIRNFVMSDEKYNDSKAITELAKTEAGINKIKKWRATIYNKISMSPSQYGNKLSYGGTRDRLNAIVKAYDDNKDEDEETRMAAIEEAIEGTSGDLNEAADTYNRQVKYLLNNLRSQLEERATVPFDDVMEDITPYSDVGGVETGDAEKVKTMVGKVLGVITNIGIVVSVLMSAILGIKYILGSPDEKAEYKKDMIPYLVGIVLLFSICSVVKVIQVMGESINNL